MRNFLIFLFLYPCLLSAQQKVSFKRQADSLLWIGKAEFRKPYEEQNFQESVKALELAVLLDPDNPETHYFLGYTYSRLNAKDGEGMLGMKRTLLEACSREFEKVIQLSPQYTGNLVVLDPYSKMTSEWGAMALSYEARHQPDSVKWALEEGKRRGAFGKFFLEVNRYILEHCSKHALLLTSGDNLTFPLYYVQQVEGYRTDVSVVNVSLLNTRWYPKMLMENKKIFVDMNEKVLDTLGVRSFKDSMVHVSNKYSLKEFYWTINASQNGGMLWRSDQILWSMLRANQFESEVFFTTNFDPSEQIGLGKHTLSHILVEELNINHKPSDDFKQYTLEIQKVLGFIKEVNLNSTDEKNFVQVIRYNLLLHLDESHKNKKKKEVKQLLKWIDAYIPEETYPYPSKELKQYVDHIRKQY